MKEGHKINSEVTCDASVLAGHGHSSNGIPKLLRRDRGLGTSDPPYVVRTGVQLVPRVLYGGSPCGVYENPHCEGSDTVRGRGPLNDTPFAFEGSGGKGERKEVGEDGGSEGDGRRWRGGEEV